MVFESIVKELLNRYLGEYVENLDANQLNVGIWSGEFVYMWIFKNRNVYVASPLDDGGGHPSLTGCVPLLQYDKKTPNLLSDWDVYRWWRCNLAYRDKLHKV